MKNIEGSSASALLVYIADCNLATVLGMATLKLKTKYEFNRQISIAQKNGQLDSC